MKKKNKFVLYKTTGKHCRPTENHCIKYNDTIVMIIPDYIELECINLMIKALNNGIKKLPLGW